MNQFIIYLKKSFLVKFYRFHPIGAVFLFLFFLLSISINYKWGMTIYPIIHYGMYSGHHSLHEKKMMIRPRLHSSSFSEEKYSDYNSYQRECMIFYSINHKSSYDRIVDIDLTIYRRFGISFNNNFSNYPSTNTFNRFHREFQKKNLNLDIDSISYLSENWVWNNNQCIKINE